MGGLTKREQIVLGLVVLATALAAATKYGGVTPVLAFTLAALALAGQAYVVSLATEQVGERFGPAVTGVLQSTLGNLPELFVVIFALRAGQIVVAQTSIVGSLLANALLVLGIVIIVGARRAPDGVMRFKARLPNDTATLMLVCVFVIVLVGLSLASHDPASHHVRGISTVAAVALLVVYASWVIPYLHSDTPDAERTTPRLALSTAITLLVVAGTASAFASDWLIDALTPTIAKLHISEAFAGLVLVAIAGNAVENVAGIALASKGRSDLAVSVVKNSVAQIAAFLFPALVLISLLFAHTLTFALPPLLIGALALTAITVWQVTGDGEAMAFEGWALVALYVVVATVTLYE